MTRLLIFSILMLTFLSVPTAVQAQEKVELRTASHDGYQRIVFDWTSAATYTVSREGASLTVAFSKAGNADLSGVTSLDNISAVKVIAANPLKISLRVPEKSRLRDIKAGSKIIIDVYDPPGGRVKAAAEKPQKPAPVPQTKPVQEEAQKPPLEQDAKPSAQEANASSSPAPEPAGIPDKEAQAVIEEKQKVDAIVPDKSSEVIAENPVAVPAIEPHVMTITATNKIGLTVFERGDWLWIVTDEPNMNVPPALSGPQVDMFGLMQRFDIEDGTAYRLKKPENVGITAEGGGLRWRLVFSPNQKEVTTIAPQRLSPVATPPETTAPRQGASLLWPLKEPRTILELEDPDIGDTIKIVTLAASSPSVRTPFRFVELETLPSYVGLAFLPLADDVAVSVREDGVRIGRGEKDLSLSMGMDSRVSALAHSIEEAREAQPIININNILHPVRWQMGGITALPDNQSVLMTGLTVKPSDGRAEDFLTLAKMSLANNRGSEALGYLRMAQFFLPNLAENPEFIALRGTAAYLTGQPDLAIIDLLNPVLDNYNDIPYWRTATLGALEDWQQAAERMPRDASGLKDYPDVLRTPLTLMLVEAALRNGKVMEAERMLAKLEPSVAMMPSYEKKSWTYLMGEAARQLKQYKKAKQFWQELADSKDGYFRVKGGLALTQLLRERNEIDAAQAVDRLESFRYAWRGDELEALVNYRLGQVYIDNKDYLKGLHVLRNAASLTTGSHLGREITEFMTVSFRKLFDSGDLQAISPIDSIGVYEEFKELTPGGEEGDRIAEQLAERMIDADLLGRAESLLSYQLQHRLTGLEAARVSLRLATVQLLNNKPMSALKSLEQAEALYGQGEGGVVPPEKTREITLLRANALSKNGQAEEAIDLLETLPADKIVARLRADVAWKNQRWSEAADSLQSLIDVEQIRADQPLSAEQTDLILNRGIALNLAGDRVAMGTLRERYSTQMAQTPKGELFDVVTLPRRFGLIRSRDTIAESINNVDLFKDFLENYRKADTQNPQSEAAPAPVEETTTPASAPATE